MRRFAAKRDIKWRVTKWNGNKAVWFGFKIHKTATYLLFGPTEKNDENGGPGVIYEGAGIDFPWGPWDLRHLSRGWES